MNTGSHAAIDPVYGAGQDSRRSAMRRKQFTYHGTYPIIGTILLCLLALAGTSSCGGGGSSSGDSSLPALVVNSLLDDGTPPTGTVTLRSAIASAASNQRITFDQSLNGGTINLIFVGDEHTVLVGEVMGFDEANNISYLVGYFDRDYGKSALFANKNVVLDASNLPDGITIRWDGADSARVLAVSGDLTLINAAITGGNSVFDVAENIGQHPNDNQTSTLARGAGLAVWGVATLIDCAIYDNHAVGDDSDTSRDGGAYGGGVYADTVVMDNCIVSGNTVYGGGAAGGGIFSVGGRDTRNNVSSIRRSAITENSITGLFAYGGGVYSDGGGIGLSTRIHVENSTIARNLVEPPLLPPFLFTLLDIGYWRGGGLYMSNGYMEVQSSTIVENQVLGKPRITELGKQNIAGGIAATIGNAHAVEDMIIGHSIVVGNTVHEINGVDPVAIRSGAFIRTIFLPGPCSSSAAWDTTGSGSSILVRYWCRSVSQAGLRYRASIIRRWLTRMAWSLVMCSAVRRCLHLSTPRVLKPILLRCFITSLPAAHWTSFLAETTT